ncbi:MAG TPA: hypothetical protein VHS05_10400 [Pyrinomonadaceae bacterium]|nr:hypothetical protein [Pyrinomonadaceae bacterium]
MAATPRMPGRINDRRLYILAAIITPLIVLAGFARTYYLKPFFGTPDLPGRIVHLHGIVMTAWVLLFIVQISLVATRRTRVHQRLGIAGGVLAALVVVVGVLTALFAAARGATPGPPPLAFLVVPLGDMLVFSVLIGLALYFRRKLQVHKRLMLLAAINLLTPAIARIPLSFIINGGPLAFFGLTDLVLVAFVAYDTIKHRRLHPVFLWGSIFIIAMQPLRLLLAGTGVWMNFAAALVALVK